MSRATKNFGGVIWTSHSLTRMRERMIDQGDAWATWRRPDSSKYAKSRGGWVYKRKFGLQEIEVVAKKNEKNKWLILSVWSRPIRKIYKSNKSSISSFFKRLFT